MVGIVVPFSCFGSDNEALYLEYIRACGGRDCSSVENAGFGGDIERAVGSGKELVDWSAIAAVFRAASAGVNCEQAAHGLGGVRFGGPGLVQDAARERVRCDTCAGLDGAAGESVGRTNVGAVGDGDDMARGVSAVETDGRLNVHGDAGGIVVGVLGKCNAKNRRQRANRKKRAMDSDWRRSDSERTSAGYFARCSGAVQDELRESRARMLVAQNEAAAERAKVDAVRARVTVESRAVETKAEVDRLKIDAEYRKIVKSIHDQLPIGFAETLVSEGLQSSVPSLSSGSVSPNSSISVAEEKRLREENADLLKRVAELTTVKSQRDARIAVLEAEQKSGVVDVRDSFKIRGFDSELDRDGMYGLF